jgi:hypothetical protein
MDETPGSAFDASPALDAAGRLRVVCFDIAHASEDLKLTE